MARAVVGRAVVVGGGPAGLMAAEVLAEGGADVAVYEHMPSVGRKLLLAGRGGLNLTHSEPVEALLSRYGAAAPQVAALLDAFGQDALRSWSAGLGQPTFVGSSGRVFPESFRATPLLRAWLRRLADLGVQFELRQRWVGWSEPPGGVSGPPPLRFVAVDGTVTEVSAGAAVFALGGASWPRVGSDGGWVAPFTEAGIAVASLRPANVGVRVAWSDAFAQRFEGVPLKYVGVSVAGGRAVRGDAMVTRTGLEGGPIYAIGAAIRADVDATGRCGLTVDLRPDLTAAQLARRLRNRRPKDSVSNWLRRSIGLDPVGVGLLREATGGELPSNLDELAGLITAVPVMVEGLMPIGRAISTAGGVEWSELDESLMLRRLPGTFVAGEMIDWEAPTGGYLLQASFASGVVAGRGALAWTS